MKKLYLARLRKGGKTFEIILDPNYIEELIKYKEGLIKDIDISKALYVDEIFLDARNANRANEELLKKVFKTTDIYQIAKRIIKEGKLEIPTEIKRKELEEKYKRLVDILAAYGRDARNNLPIPIQRIENALSQIKVNIKENIPIEFQIRKIVEKLMPILPIKFNKRIITIKIPPKYLDLMPIIREYFIINRENWLNDGSWLAEIEVLEPQESVLIEYLTKKSNGEIEIK